MTLRRRALGLLVLAAPAVAHAQAAPAAGQDRRPCLIEIIGVRRGDQQTSFNVYRAADSSRITYVSNGVDARCVGQGNRLLADSAEHYEGQGMLILFRNVRYTEPGARMTADRMTYFTVDERLLAEGNVRGTTESGTRFAGPRVEYLRAKPGLRSVTRWYATGRPTVRMSPDRQDAGAAAPRDTAAAGDSVDITANTITSENDSLVWASGQVVIERPDLRATADSATLDEGAEFARLMRQPRIVGRGERPFTLDGVEIDLWSRARRLERVLSSGDARVVSDSLTLTADTIDMRLAEQRMERVYTWGGRSRAETPSQRIDADSLDIRMPGQRLREVHAIGTARATSQADTSQIVTEEPDWIEGDTIAAQFDTVATADSTDQPRMRLVVATGQARSFYQMAPRKGEKTLPNISISRGRVITVAFEAGEVTTVEVIDQASGIFLEPVRTDTTRAAAPPRRP